LELMVFTVCMDRHTDKSHGVVSRLTVVETGRRRRWSDSEKLRIVEESLAGHRQVSATARRHGIATSLLFKWRRDLLGDPVTPETAAPAFMPVTVVPEARVPQGEAGRLEIVLTNGRRIIIGSGIDPAWLAQVLRVAEGS
jgi:transposase